MAHHVIRKDLQSYEAPRIKQNYSESNWPSVIEVTDPIEPDRRWREDLQMTTLDEAEVILQTIPDGFIKDFVYATRGNEAPTLFCIWAAIFIVSSALQRRAYLDFKLTRLFPNLFLLFIAPPGTKKSTTVLYGSELLGRVKSTFRETHDQILYDIPVFSGRATPESIPEMMSPQKVSLPLEGSDFNEPVNIGSRLVVVVDELAQFMGKQKYNIGLPTLLTTLYDCKTRDSVATVKNKLRHMENIFFNFFGATTPTGFRDAIPAESHGEGLMSRFVICNIDSTAREYRVPVTYAGAPESDELVRRLAWIAQYKSGEYTISSEADTEYAPWYARHKDMLKTGEVTEADSRRDTILLKTAMLLRAQTYEQPRRALKWEIDEKSFIAASELIRVASEHKNSAQDLLIDSFWARSIKRIARLLKTNGTMSRTELLRSVSRSISAAQLDELLGTLAQSEEIAIFYDGQRRPRPSRHGDEFYSYQGMQSEDASEDDT